MMRLLFGQTSQYVADLSLDELRLELDALEAVRHSLIQRIHLLETARSRASEEQLGHISKASAERVAFSGEEVVTVSPIDYFASGGAFGAS
jgi:hypothetical protein